MWLSIILMAVVSQLLQVIKIQKYIPNKPVIDWILSKEYKLKLHTPTPYREFGV